MKAIFSSEEPVEPDKTNIAGIFSPKGQFETELSAAKVSDNKTIFFSTPNPKIEINYQLQSLTFELVSNCHYLGREPKTSNGAFKVPGDWSIFSRCQACFRKIGNDYYIYDGDGESSSKNGIFINNQLITPKEGYCLQDGDEIKVGQNPLSLATIVYLNPKTPFSAPPKQRSVYLDKGTVTLGRNHNADFELDAPTVSRRHAVINTDAQGRYILRDYSANGVFINRQKVSGTAVLSPGSLVQIGPYTLVLQGNELVLVDQGNNIRLDARNLVQVVSNKNKQKRRILDDISLAIEPGQLVALVGGSGAGKSTLMKSLLGIEPITEGVVYLNGDDLKRNFNIYRNLIGYVPQHDIVHTNLTVKEILYYAAKLRLSPDINIEAVIEKTIQQVELTEHQNTLAKNLSGGQLKRVSIAVELLADPKLFFLDEPTSGLDPGLDKEMMQLLRSLANSGRTIILVTHATTNINLCDRLVFLGAGGKLCYYGTPDKAIDFFQIDSGDFADIYIKLKSKYNVVEEAERYSQSEYKREFVNEKLRAFNQQKHQPPQQANSSFLQQLSILIQRYVKLILRDKVNLALVLLTAPIAIALITLAIYGKNPLVGQPDYERASLARTVLFIFTCASMWIGLASSLQEIVKESAIYLRERLVNLSLFSYLSSKILTLGGLGVIQSLLITLIILIGFKSPVPKLIISYINPEDNPFISIPWFLGVFITSFLTILASVSLGLMVSASVKNNTQANSALPILLLPQIIFSGVLFNIDKLQLGKYISWLMLSRWSVGAYGTLARINLLVPGHSQENTPIKESPMFDSDLKNLAINWGILLLYTVIYSAMTLWLQQRKDVIK